MSEQTKLKPCPFCGSESLTFGFFTHSIGCECGCHGPTAENAVESEAAELWNTRPVTPTEEKEA